MKWSSSHKVNEKIAATALSFQNSLPSEKEPFASSTHQDFATHGSCGLSINKKILVTEMQFTNVIFLVK